MLNRDYEKDIVLAERTYSLPEVNITKGNEDPAYAVMRKAMLARAPYYRTQIKSYSTQQQHLKGTGKGTAAAAVPETIQRGAEECKRNGLESCLSWSNSRL